MLSQDRSEDEYKKSVPRDCPWPFVAFNEPGTRKAWQKFNDGFVPYLCIVEPKSSKIISKMGSSEIGKGKRALDEWLDIAKK